MKNYSLFKQDQKQLINSFNEIFLRIINFFNQELTIIKNSKKAQDLEKQFDECVKLDLRNIKDIKDILDECIWIIQKHEPRTNHLRLIITIINSLSDLKRMSSYVVTFLRFFHKYNSKVNDKLKNNLIKISDLCFKTTQEFYQLILKYKCNNIKEESDKLFNKFLKEYKKFYLDLIKESNNKKHNPKMIASYIILLKNIDRSIDHCVNIVENFISI